MLFTMMSWLARGRPRQFMVMRENSRCSILFHFEVPGGKWQQVISSPVSAGQVRQPGLPGPGPVAVGPAGVGGDQQPPRAGVVFRPRPCHQRRIDSTANAAVSRSVPTLTQPALAARS